MDKRKKSILLVIGLLVLTVLPSASLAVTPTVTEVDGVVQYSLTFDQKLIQKGETISTTDGSFRLGVFPKVLAKPTTITIKQRLAPEQTLPDNLTQVSDYWEIDLADKKAYNGTKPLIVELQYQDNVAFKKVIFWNGQDWQMVPSKIIGPEQRIIRVAFYLPYVRFLVVADSGVLTTGLASWYRYKGCHCAASPDFPKGTLLKVTNLDNNKSVEVKVNDYGPDRSIHPDRAIDLDVTAFKKIAAKAAGVIRVLVEPVFRI